MRNPLYLYSALGLLALILLATPACYGLSTAKEKFRVLHFSLSEVRVSVPIPAQRQSPDTIVSAPIERLDLNQLSGLQGKNQQLFSGIWDWDRGLFSDGPRSLVIKIRAQEFPDGISMNCVHNLREFAQAWAKDGSLSQLKLDAQFRSVYTLEDVGVIIGGQPSAKLISRGFKNSTKYIIPITDGHYVFVDFTFLASEKPGPDGQWSPADAKWLKIVDGLANEIMSGIQIQGAAELRDCR